ncbi:MAG TPA: exodeoxyribonuclease VII small subunit [Planctomycetaceae bacterium]|nr:exodeoxyribonuclease VII small subunit [Planctomycetaceae bacterium]
MAKKKAANKSKDQSVAFEEAMAELETIVRRLDSGEGTLDEALEDYSKAIELLKTCHLRLDGAQKKIEILTGLDADGTPTTVPFEAGAEALDEKRSSRARRRSSGPADSSEVADQPDDGLF